MNTGGKNKIKRMPLSLLLGIVKEVILTSSTLLAPLERPECRASLETMYLTASQLGFNPSTHPSASIY